LPVFHAGYFRHTLTILQCICKQCSRVLLGPEDRLSFLKKVKSPNLDALIRGALFKRIIELCKRNSMCPYCGYANGVVKKLSGGLFKIVHERHRAKNADDQMEMLVRQMSEIIKSYPDLKPNISKGTELLTPMRAYEMFSQITDEDLLLLWMQGNFGRPESLITWAVPVPPVPIRPSVPQEMGGGSTEDDLTVKLQEIIEMNNALRIALEKGATMKMVAEDWEFLQIQVALYINGETPGIPRQLMGNKSLRGLCQRLKGKQGRFRGNLSGKRVDFSARTVISPDPNLQINQVGVPIMVAKIMTYPERVNRYNIDRMRKLVMNGPEKHPGANIVRSGHHVSALQYADKDRAALNLKIGDIVERHMDDDDVVLFNRQPSLHKMSIMAHRVKVMPWKTFRFNECACTPYNADFDGDEMNMHLPQTEEAKAEAAELMAITYNLVSPRNGEPLVAATQDFLTGAYLLTQKDVFLSKEQFCRLVAFLSDATEHIDMPLPTIWKPHRLWTGKQVISLLVRPNKQSKSSVNVESEERFYTSDKHFCPQDGFVSFRQGELISGNLGKKTLGGDSKSGLYYVLIRDFGPVEAIRCMSRLAKLTSRFLCDRGFSIGIDDVTPSPNMLSIKEKILRDGQRSADEQISLYKNGRIRLKPGCDALQSLESEVNGILGKIRENCGKEALNALNHRNAPLSMAQCGSKGSALNISQMIAALGQQSVGGQRIQDGFVNRTLPHFPVGSLSPAAKGFVANSFFSGLTATEFFFHTMGGREGLVDTAVKTAETGYMARRLMKALEDLSLQYDNTVRNSEQTIVQFIYGDDGLNPQLMEKGDRPVDYHRLMINVCGDFADIESESLLSDEIITIVSEELAKPKFQDLLPQGKQFIDETLHFFAMKGQQLKLLEPSTLENSLTTISADMLLEDDSSNSLIKYNAKNIRSYIHSLTKREKLDFGERANNPQNIEFSQIQALIRDTTSRLTYHQLKRILELALRKYLKSQIEPGEAVGAVGAQSLSEPGTQMTLKTFHFAGVASMNVTLGVPRLKEIINASNQISTPIIEARLHQTDSITSARIVKAQIEKTTLGEICEYIKEIHRDDSSYLSIKLDFQCIESLHLQVTAHSVKQAILHSSTGTTRPLILRSLKDKHILINDKGNKIKIFPPDLHSSSSSSNSGFNKGIPSHQRLYFVLQSLKSVIPSVIIQGIPTVSRAVINEENDSKTGRKVFYLLVEGYGLQDVMNCPGVDSKYSKSNHIIEMQRVLGIEAARSMISSEIKYIMTAYGITVDRRHLMLLSDVMTFKGEVLGITRFGVAKMKESVLMLASFEKTTDHLFDAAVHSREDSIVGVSECIIMGVPIPIGTGLMKLMQKFPSECTIKAHKKTRLLECLGMGSELK
jgi:DNA-directed RNA polymerase III subunit RPC1